MLEYTLDTNEQFNALKTVINAVNELLESNPRTFTFTPEGITFESMDQGSVFVYFLIKKEFFTTYECKNEKLELRLNIGELKKCFPEKLNSKQKEYSIYSFSDSNKFQVKYDSEVEGFIKKQYDIPLHNPDDDEEKRNIAEVIKSIPLSAFIDLLPTNFSRILTDCKISSQNDKDPTTHLVITTNETNAKFETFGGSDKMDSHVELPLISATSQRILEDQVKASYDATYLIHLKKIDGKAQKVTFEFGNDKPLRLTFTIANNIEFIFVMAPLVEEEDEDPEENDD